MAEKRFYWIKLKESFFINNELTDWIISQPNGCEYIVLYLKLCILTANKGGRLAMQIGEMLIPYDAKKISVDTKFDIDTVIVAMELFKQIGLIYEEADGVLKIPYVDEIVGSETPAAERMRKSRSKKALKPSKDVTMLQQSYEQCYTEKEKRVKSIEKRDLKNRVLDAEAVIPAEAEITASDYSKQTPFEKLEPFRYDNVFLSDAQIEALLKIMDIKVFDAYVDKISKYPNTKNHYETIKKWYEQDSRIKK